MFVINRRIVSEFDFMYKDFSGKNLLGKFPMTLHGSLSTESDGLKYTAIQMNFHCVKVKVPGTDEIIVADNLYVNFSDDDHTKGKVCVWVRDGYRCVVVGDLPEFKDPEELLDKFYKFLTEIVVKAEK